MTTVSESKLFALAASVLTAEPGAAVFEVWADALLQDGDPRGELVVLSRRVHDAPDDAAARASLDALVRANEAAFCPGCLSVGDEPRVTLGWRDGFLDRVTIVGGFAEEDAWLGYEDAFGDEDEDDSELPEGLAVRQLLDRPIAARLASIAADAPLSAEGNHGCWANHTDFLRDLLASDRPWLTNLELDPLSLPASSVHGTQSPALSMLAMGFMHDAEIKVGDIRALWARAPRLEHLVLAQPLDAVLGTIDAPKLRTLVYGSPFAEGLDAIARGSLPALETLLVRVRDGAMVTRILANPTLANVRTLGLVAVAESSSLGHADGVIDALLASPFPEQVEVLDLGGFIASDACYRKLVDAAKRFGSLRELRLTTWSIARDAEGTPEVGSWWDGDDTAPFLTEAAAPRDRAIGAALAEALPVRWLVVGGYDPSGAIPTGFLGMYDGQEGFVERRGEAPTDAPRRGA